MSSRTPAIKADFKPWSHPETDRAGARNKETLAQRCSHHIAAQAHETLLRNFGTRRGLTEELLRIEAWQTSDGRELFRLAKSPLGKRPAEEAIAEIRRSADNRFDAALRILRCA